MRSPVLSLPTVEAFNAAVFVLSIAGIGWGCWIIEEYWPRVWRIWRDRVRKFKALMRLTNRKFNTKAEGE